MGATAWKQRSEGILSRYEALFQRAWFAMRIWSSKPEKLMVGETFWFDEIVKETIALSELRLHMPNCWKERPEGHDAALQMLIRAVSEDNWRDIVACCNTQEEKEEPYQKPLFVFAETMV